MNATPPTGRPEELGRLPRDLLAGLAILIFCAIVYGISLGIPEAPAALSQNVQPATFPRMVLAVMVALTVLMMVLGLRQKDKRRRAPKMVMLLTGALMIAFVVVFEALGPLLAMVFFCVVAPINWGAKLSGRLLGFAVLFPMFVYLLFDVSLKVHFPPGVIENLIDTALN